jgi:dihydrolipoamide dehydrogenase
VRRRSAPLSIVFSDPDLAVVGKRFHSLPPDAVVATTRGSGNGRSKIMQAPHHVLLRLYADASSRKLLGASIFCAGGEHLATSWPGRCSAAKPRRACAICRTTTPRWRR